MKETVDIDKTDIKIMNELVKDARKKLKDIASEVGLSSVAVLKRIERLERKGVITETTIFKGVDLLGHPYPALIGVNLEGDKETIIGELCSEHTNLAGVSPSVGKYDLCVFAVAKNLFELDALRRSIREKRGVKRVVVNIWTKPYFNFDSFELKPTGE